MAVLEWKKRTRGLLALVRRPSPAASTREGPEERNERAWRSEPARGPSASDLTNTVFQYGGPCPAAVKAFRKKAKEHGLRVTFEFNVADYIENALGIGLRPCRVLCVVCPYLLLQAAVLDGSGASFLPVRVVFCGKGSHTEIRVVGPFDPLLPNGLRAPFQRFFQTLAAVLTEMGARPSDFRPCA